MIFIHWLLNGKRELNVITFQMLIINQNNQEINNHNNLPYIVLFKSPQLQIKLQLINKNFNQEKYLNKEKVLMLSLSSLLMRILLHLEIQVNLVGKNHFKCKDQIPMIQDQYLILIQINQIILATMNMLKRILFLK